MYTITRNDFEDEISRTIFDLRKKFYEEKNWKYLLQLVCRMHNSIAKKLNGLDGFNTEFRKKVQTIEKNVVIFGTGVSGHGTIQYLEKYDLAYKVSAFCDNDPQKQNRIIFDKTVVPVNEVVENSDQYFVIIPYSRWTRDMKKQLIEEGFPPQQIVIAPPSVWHFDDLESDCDYERILFNPDHHFVIYEDSEVLGGYFERIFRNLMQNAGIKIDFVARNVLSYPETFYLENMDKCYFIVLNGRNKRYLLDSGIAKEKILHFTSKIDYAQYFDTDILPVHKNGVEEIFIDGGSCNLETSDQFLDWCNGECKKIYAFECDSQGVIDCENRLKKDVQLSAVTELISRGLWSEETILSFKENELERSASRVVTGKESADVVKIQVTSIDNVLKGEPVTFIKLDIEGSELEALKGARESIQKWKPTLAISVYHKPEDIITIPTIIKEIEPGYKLYLRCYHEDYTETVLYAIYEEEA